MIELEHSPLGGSGAHRFLNCDGSFLKQREAIEDGTFEDIPSEFANLGTGAHELGARCLIEGTEPFEYLGEKFNGYLAGWPDGIKLDAVQIYVNDCRSIVERCDDGTVLVEKTIKLPALHPLLKGTVDFGYYSKRQGIFLRDYKNGEGIGVSAVNNPQLLYYGFLMIMQHADWRVADRETPVNLGICQPNFYGIYEEPDVWITTIGFVRDWGEKTLLPKMDALLSRSTLPVENDFQMGSWCQFCPVLLDCPKQRRAYQEYVEAEEDFIIMLTNEELSHLYANREQVKRFTTTLENTIRARVLGGSTIASAKLVEKKMNRTWKPGADVAIKATFGDKAMTVPELKSPAQIEKLSTRGKELALEWGYKPEAAMLTIAPLSDPRPEVKPRTNADTFKAHAQSPEMAGF